ncbi:MAG: biopolymer transporter ExbD [Candidatus Edwardsbacteria bacterium]
MGAVEGMPARERPKKGFGLKRPKHRAGIKLDMTPMVDIGFLLLIFFMCTTIFREPQAIEITLPPTTTEIKTAMSNVLIIQISEEGTILQNIGEEEPQPIVVDSLGSLFEKKMRENVESQPDHIDAKTGVHYPSGQEILKLITSLPKEAKTERDSLEKVMREKICRLTILVKVHRKSRYEKVVEVMDQITYSQMPRFSIVELVEEQGTANKKKPGAKR